jgi:hypothetical protein
MGSLPPYKNKLFLRQSLMPNRLKAAISFLKIHPKPLNDIQKQQRATEIKVIVQHINILSKFYQPAKFAQMLLAAPRYIQRAYADAY